MSAAGVSARTDDPDYFAYNSYTDFADDAAEQTYLDEVARRAFYTAGDYFVPTGIHNRDVLDQYLPEGYQQTVTGDIQFVYGQHCDITVEPIPPAPAGGIPFRPPVWYNGGSGGAAPGLCGPRRKPREVSL